MASAGSSDPLASESLQFDHAEFTTDAPAAVNCRGCNRPIHDVYYELNQALLCDGCRQAVEARFLGGSGLLRFTKAVALGLLAALAGSIILYAFGAITGYSVGIISILVGYLVGRAVSRGAEHRGGVVYQTLAVFLTYSAVAWSFLPLLAVGLAERAEARKAAIHAETTRPGDAKSAVRPDAAGPAKAGSTELKKEEDAGPRDAQVATVGNTPAQPTREIATPRVDTEQGEEPLKGAALAVVGMVLVSVVLMGLAYAAPFLGLPENLIGLLIIFFGLQQAWRLNRKLALRVNGPFRVGEGGPPVGEATAHA